ncbi:TIGR00730 family Rossman fold protein [Salinicoccus hispanicus]|uniref:Cytokinin riboside 5'-monophosphate phosphoribohydrolase n=1 Tax=Salinicoccus hispanicus TaxID=157225 RepID=A0A6N8U386_9STAP|nr:TIGR00730 family Rossman fold protein [Salinicoccus hispanicus]MXQ50671.1 TIGR00730 family Rossman fold protein [Salinicoccus hispanicus]
MKIRNVTIFCGARTGDDPIYEKQAYALGALLAEKGIGVIFGGGAIGLMGAVADGALSKGGTVTGVIPQFLVEREMAHPDAQHMEVVETMHERKARMEELGDAIITLPGGAGTMEEFFEIFTWGQLGLQKKPIGLLDVNHFFDTLTHLFEKLIAEGFLEEKYMGLLFISDDAADILKSFETFEPVKARTYGTEKRRP